MPRSSSPKIPERKVSTVKQLPYTNLPAIIPQKPSFLQTVKDGIGYGIGSSLGHRLVGSIMGYSHDGGRSFDGSPTIVQKPTLEYEQCMKDNNDKAGCEYLLRINH